MDDRSQRLEVRSFRLPLNENVLLFDQFPCTRAKVRHYFVFKKKSVAARNVRWTFSKIVSFALGSWLTFATLDRQRTSFKIYRQLLGFHGTAGKQTHAVILQLQSEFNTLYSPCHAMPCHAMPCHVSSHILLSSPP